MSKGQKSAVSKISSPYIEDYELQEQSKYRKRRGLVRRLVAIAGCSGALFFLIGMAYHNSVEALEDKQKKKAQLVDQLHKLKSDHKALEEEIVKLNDDEYIAELARRDYFLSKDNEIIFHLDEETHDGQ